MKDLAIFIISLACSILVVAIAMNTIKQNNNLICVHAKVVNQKAVCAIYLNGAFR